MRLSIRFAALALVCTACSHDPRPETAGTAKSDQLITEQEIADSQVLTAYDAIVKLRANFLSNRGKTTIVGNSPTVPTVFLDGLVYGTPTSLKNIAAGQVASIRLYRAWEATTKFGGKYVAGVIEVITKSQ